MKRINPLAGPTPGLAAYLSQQGNATDWEGFRRGDRTAFQEFRDKLVATQHGLCGYCEISLHSDGNVDDVQVEHIIPKSGSESGEAQALNYENLIASCLGGTARLRFGPEAHTADPERYLSPQSDSISCGQAKRDDYPSGFIDPRVLPVFPALFRVNSEGVIEANENACASSGISVCLARATIILLGLNVTRLRRARREQWSALTAALHRYRSVPGGAESLARRMLLPDNSGNLHKFFTTSRSRFGVQGERILAEPPQAWV